jgi:hypothetical protein
VGAAINATGHAALTVCRRLSRRGIKLHSVCVALEVLMSPSLVPSPDHNLHFVLCDFGKYGKTYIETAPSEADRDI